MICSFVNLYFFLAIMDNQKDDHENWNKWFLSQLHYMSRSLRCG